MQNDKVHLSAGQPSAAEGRERRRPKGPLRGTDVDLGRAVQENRTNGAVPADDLVIAGRYARRQPRMLPRPLTNRRQVSNHEGRTPRRAMRSPRKRPVDESTRLLEALLEIFATSQEIDQHAQCHGRVQTRLQVTRAEWGAGTGRSHHAGCRLIEMLPGTEHLPPCLVFEAGAFTLAQRLGGRAMAPGEKLAIVHAVGSLQLGLCVSSGGAVQILTALGDLHQRKIAHGNLDPSHIVWSSADLCWKFADLDFAARFGDPLPLHQRVATRYTAPEIRRAIDEDISAPADGSADIWAFGLIAFEIFTGEIHRSRPLVSDRSSCLQERRQSTPPL